MAELSIFEMRPPRPAVWTSQGLTASRAFDVYAESQDHARRRVASRFGVVRHAIYISPYGEVPDALCVCQQISIEGRPHAPVGGVGRYIVTADYGRSSGGAGGTQEAEPGRTLVYVEQSRASIPVDHDLRGFAIENAVEEPVDPPLTKRQTGEILHVEWFVKSEDHMAVYASLREFNDSVNSAALFGAPKGSLLWGGAEAKPPNDGLVHVHAQLEYRAPKSLSGVTKFYTRGSSPSGWVEVSGPIEGWADVWTHKGRREKVGSHTDPISERYADILTRDGNPITDPVTLDINGVPVTDDKSYAIVTYHYPYKNFRDAGF